MVEVKLASEQQRKLFFALCHDAEIDSEKAKEKAKKKFGVDSFLSLSSFQISELIEKLQEKIDTKSKDHAHIWGVEARSQHRIFSQCSQCPAIMIETC